MNATFNKKFDVVHSFGSVLTLLLLTTYGNLSKASVITDYIMDPYLADLKTTTWDVYKLRKTMVSCNWGKRSNDGWNCTCCSDGTLLNSNKHYNGSRRIRIEGTGICTLNTTKHYDERGGFTKPTEYWHSTRSQEISAVHDREFDDLIYACNCKGTYNRAIVEGLFPVEKDVDFFVQQGTGHGWKTHRKGNIGVKATFEWLDRNGLYG